MNCIHTINLLINKCFAKFFDVFARFFDVFGPLRTCFDTFGYSRIHSDTFGCFGPKKTRQKFLKKNENLFVANFAVFFDVFKRFWESWWQTDLKISFCIKFCSRYTYPEVCATQICEKMACTRPLPALSPHLAPGSGLVQVSWLLGCVCLCVGVCVSVCVCVCVVYFL